MIFAALTGTPCLVFKTYNHKVVEQYQWINELDFINLIDFNLEKIHSLIGYYNNQLNYVNRNVNRNKFDEKFQKIVDLLEV